MRTELLLTLLGTQIALWASYYVFGVDDSLWGRTPKGLRPYLIGSAFVAYVFSLVSVSTLHLDGNSGMLLPVLSCLVAYYALQILFVPFVKRTLSGKMDPNWVRGLLLACCLPMILLAGISLKQGPLWSALLSIVATAHVVVNDAILYGFLFD